ncbi:MAG TPA: YceI family protein [Acidimicrobiales bacterium]|nr:YceI family protein [Acidimicrobiales bacterium]
MTVTESQQLTRSHDGTIVPRPGSYVIDKAHSTVEFVARHLMVSKVRGRFDDFQGVLRIAQVPEESNVVVTINASSISTGEPNRDKHLLSADFFEVETYPTVEFRSTKVEHHRAESWKVTGDLTLHGVTRPVVLDVEFAGASPTPWGTNAIGFTASTEIDREEWGLTWNAALETGGVVVSKRIRIELEVEASEASSA